MRLFVAIDAETAPGREGSGAPAHLTLCFLGETRAERIPELVAALQRVGRSFAPFEMTFDGVGAFPTRAAPRVVWIGVTQGGSEVADLAGRIRKALEPYLPDERDAAFVPHLTWFRVRSPADRRAALEALRGDRPAPRARTVRVGEFVLKASELGPGEAHHRTLASFRLEGSEPVGSS